ncbi:MAG: hypothetical protein SGILL_002630 [Bacillariaceae sp.]
MASEESAAERKRKRLEAWRKRQQDAAPTLAAPAVKVSLSLGSAAKKLKKKNRAPELRPITSRSINPFGAIDDDDRHDDDSDSDDEGRGKKGKLSIGLGFAITEEETKTKEDTQEAVRPRKRQKKGRWDAAPPPVAKTEEDSKISTDDKMEIETSDALDSFMDTLQSGALGNVTTQVSSGGAELLNIDVGGSMMRVPRLQQNHPAAPAAVSGGVITSEQIELLTGAAGSFKPKLSKNKRANPDALYTQSDWESDAPSGTGAASASEPETEDDDEEEEEKARRAFIEALKSAPTHEEIQEENEIEKPSLAAEVKSEKDRRERMLRSLEQQAEEARTLAEKSAAPDLGRLYNDEGGIMEEAERNLDAAMAAPDALQVLAELNKKKELKSVDHSSIDYIPIKKNIYIVPRSLASLSNDEVADVRAKVKVKVRGHGAPAPVSSFEQCGLSERILAVLEKQGITKPFPVQAQCIPCIMAGRDTIAEQIGDLKRGAHIVVATPGRLIDILTMQSGKLLSLQRVTYVVMDEADRMYDMGFSPQITAILAAIRPDRQTVLFSATFPKSVETLARKSLKYPLEVIVGGRSVASDSVVQHAELVEEDDKFFRLLQLLGENVDETKKGIVFVDTQVRADNLFEQLLRNGYFASSLHGGKEQEDRDSTIADFKRKDGSNVLVATSLAGRGLDVPSCSCVINYSCPNHLEAYVHQVGRTGRAANKGVAYTMVNSAEEAKYAPNIVRAMSEAGQSENISPELKALSDSFKEKVQKGEAKWASSGYKGRGYTYDASEMNEAQKFAQSEKRQALIEAGVLDPEDEDPLEESGVKDMDADTTAADGGKKSEAEKTLDLQTKLTPELLALPGMKDAILRRAGIVKEEEDDPSLGKPVQMGNNHWIQEFEINDYPREARWKVTQKETTSRLQDEFQTAVTLKGSYFGPGRTPSDGERQLYLHLEATGEHILQNCVVEIKRLLNEETLRVSAKGSSSASSSHKYSVLGK